MPVIYETALVEKRNVLNELRSNNMTLQELRFLSIYLAKINHKDVRTRVVRFPLYDFQRIMEIGRINVHHTKNCVDSLLTKIVHIPNENGGFTAFQLFKECKVAHDENGVWYIEIDAHDKALPLMFDFKTHYFKYELWNALRLKSANQVRMYELLKQYEGLGRREIAVDELRAMIGISKKEYPRWDNFRSKVLDACQKAINELTDIQISYERGKTGQGGKWLTIVFNIERNQFFVDSLELRKFIDTEMLKFEEHDVIDAEYAEVKPKRRRKSAEMISDRPVRSTDAVSKEDFSEEYPKLTNKEVMLIKLRISMCYPDYNEKQVKSTLDYLYISCEDKAKRNLEKYMERKLVNELANTCYDIDDDPDDPELAKYKICENNFD